MCVILHCCLKQRDEDQCVADHAAKPGDGADAACGEARQIDDRIEHAGDDEDLRTEHAEPGTAADHHERDCEARINQQIFEMVEIGATCATAPAAGCCGL